VRCNRTSAGLIGLGLEPLPLLTIFADRISF